MAPRRPRAGFEPATQGNLVGVRGGGVRLTYSKEPPAVVARARAACLCLILFASTAATADAAATCRGSGEVPNGANLARMRGATLCLLNQVRRHHGLHTLRANRELRAAARHHARDMITRGYYAHTPPPGDTIASRIRQAGYMRPRLHWTVAENLGWGTGLESTPAYMMNAWMHSHVHRSNILWPGFRQVGIHVEMGVPLRGAAQGATFANE